MGTVIASLGVVRSQPDRVQSETRSAFVARTPETLIHDADGNLVRDGRWMYSWDAENRLTRVMSYGATDRGSWCRVEWKYDAWGRRVRQTSYVYTNRAWQGVEDLKIVGDPVLFGRHVAELNATNNSLVRAYMWGLDLSETLDGAGGVGGLLWVRVQAGPASGTHFVCYDGNGNLWNLVSASTGTETARYGYGPFGEPLRLSGPAARSNPFRFSTKRTEDISGLVLYEYRAYSPTLGRWLSRDPVPPWAAVLGDFAFVANAPTLAVELDGRKFVLACCVFAAGGFAALAVACYYHMEELRQKANEEAINQMEALDPNFDVEEDGPDVRPGGLADALRHCIGACMANQNPGPCCSSAFVRKRLQERESGDSLQDQQDRANNEVGFGVPKDCVKGCLDALRNGLLKCFEEGDSELRPCKIPGS